MEPIAADLCNRIAPLDEVEHTLDRMLDFCGEDAILGLFKNVCRHYFNIYPELTEIRNVSLPKRVANVIDDIFVKKVMATLKTLG